MTHRVHLSDDERSRLVELRSVRRKARAVKAAGFGQRVADAAASGMGSWRFIIIQSTLLAIWVMLNVTAWVQAWDPYPFILLNLMLSFQAAYAAPFIMMSQNRQSDIDRKRAVEDYDVNVKAELEIELLHEKMDLLRDQEIARLTRVVEELIAKLDARPA